MKNNIFGIFADLAKYSAVTVIVIAGVMVSAAIASSQNFQAGGSIKFKPLSAQLGIKSPATNVCPTTAKMTGWIFTNKPGQVSYMLAKKGGAVSGPFTLEAVKAVQGGMATFSRTVSINQAINADYRILVSGTNGKVLSNWAPLNASCNIQLGG